MVQTRNLENERFDERSRKRKCALCDEEENELHILLKCKKTKRWTEQFFNEKWLQINEEIVYKKINQQH
jgi:hypothetical protein